MKKKKQSCAANRHKCRPVFLIEQELREAMNDAASCLRNRNYARHQQAMQRIARLKKELEEAGLTLTDGGKHPKIQFRGDERYMLTCASTTSDVRSGDNLYSQIKKKFF